MIYEAFEITNFSESSGEVIEQADAIIRQYSAQGYTLTLRQLYYQFVSKDLIPNTERSYKRLGDIVTKGRMSGLLPWDGIEDRNRGSQGWLVEEDIDEILRDLPYGYAADLWADQDRYVEVWVEKDALGAVIERACRPFRVRWMACKGYLSASEAWRAGKRMDDAESNGKSPLVIHLGDHDPSGMDMTRDNRDRLGLFNRAPVEVQRIALNMPQIEEHSPPPTRPRCRTRGPVTTSTTTATKAGSWTPSNRP
jgi:hypothetical protein